MSAVLLLALAPLPPASTAALAGEPSGAGVLGVPHPEVPRFEAVPPAPAASAPTGTTGATTPTFQWTAVAGSVSGYYLYDLGPHDVADLGQWYPLAQVGCPTAGSTCSAASPSALPAGSHRFLVVGYNESGWGSWSSPAAYCIQACSLAVPGPPNATGPAAASVIGELPIFAWTPGSGTPTTYAVYDFSIASASFDVTDVLSASAVCQNNGPSCASSPSHKLLSGTHVLFLNSMNAEGWGGWTAGRTYCVNSCGNPFNEEFDAAPTNVAPVTGTWTTAGGLYATTGVANTFASFASSQTYPDVDIEAKVARSGCPACNNTLQIRGTVAPQGGDSDWASSYIFGYTADGQFDVFKGVGGTYTALQFYTQTSAIKQGLQFNVVRVLTSGTSLVFFINGIPVWQGTDTSLSTGVVGAAMYNDGSPNQALYVDYVHVGFPAGPSARPTANVQVSPEQQALNDAANRNAVPGSDNTRHSVAPGAPAPSVTTGPPHPPAR